MFADSSTIGLLFVLVVKCVGSDTDGVVTDVVVRVFVFAVISEQYASDSFTTDSQL